MESYTYAWKWSHLEKLERKHSSSIMQEEGHLAIQQDAEDCFLHVQTMVDFSNLSHSPMPSRQAVAKNCKYNALVDTAGIQHSDPLSAMCLFKSLKQISQEI